MSIEGNLDRRKQEKRIECGTKEEVRAAVQEVALTSLFVRSLPILMEHGARWREEDPREAILTLLNEIPDHVPVIKRSELKCISLSECQEILRNKEKPSKLEAYFLSKLVHIDPHILQLESVDEGRGDRLFPAESIMCLRDGLRTKKFTAAIERAVAVLENSGAASISVIDAGCGAVPIMGIVAALQSSKVRCVCLETSRESVAIARAAVAAFNLQEQITVLEEDATKYVPKKLADLVITETMNTGLLSEPLCNIMDHLARYMAPSGIMLPEKVQALAASVPVSVYENAPELVHIYGNAAPKLALDWRETGVYVPGTLLKKLEATLQGSDATGEGRVVLVASRVFLMGDMLDVYDSLISIPQPMAKFVNGKVVPNIYVTKTGEQLHIVYAPKTEIDKVIITKRG